MRLGIAVLFGLVANAMVTFAATATSLPVGDGYELLAYIESTGAQTIDTGLAASSNSTFCVDFTPTEVAASKILISGGTNVSTTDSQLCLRFYVNSGLHWACNAASDLSGNDASGSSSVLYTDDPTVGRRVLLELDSFGNEVRVDGKRVLRLGHARSGTGADTVCLFPDISGKGKPRMKGRLHKALVYSSGALQANLIPCRRTCDGRTGLFDLVRNRFLTNADSGSAEDFAAGPVATDLQFEVEPIPAQGWDGASPVRPTPVVKTSICRRTLTQSTDYTVSYSGNTGVGQATVTVTGRGEFAGFSAAQTFGIYRLGGAFRLASWNVGHWSNGASRATTIKYGQNDFSKTAQYRSKLELVNADWFGASEYSSVFVTNGWADAAESVFQRYPNRRIGPSHKYQWNAVFHADRFKILESKVHYYPQHEQDTYAYAHRVLVDGLYEAWFVQTHLDLKSEKRTAQVSWLVENFGNKDRVIISGDFNTSTGNESGVLPKRTVYSDYEIFSAGGFTIANPSGATHAKNILDNVLIKGFKYSGMTVFAKEGLSDHDGLVVTLEPLAAGLIAKPKDLMSPIYDGAAHAPTVPASDAYTVSCPAQTEGGTYSVTVSLKDKTRTVWEDGTTADVILSFVIAQSPNAWETTPNLAPVSWERGNPVTVTEGKSCFGTPIANYTLAELTALYPGSYEYVVSVPATDSYEGLNVSIPFRVIGPLAAQVDRRAATVDLQFPATNQVRRLCVAWGGKDYGGTTNVWPHVAELADVPADSTGLEDVAVPRAALQATGCRFFLVDVYDSTSYVSDGLKIQWDALENAGRGSHNAVAKSWKNLAGDTDDLPVSGCSFAGDCLAIPSGVSPYVRTSAEFPRDTAKTVEAVLWIDDGSISSRLSSRVLLIDVCHDVGIMARGTNDTFTCALFVDRDGKGYSMSGKDLARNSASFLAQPQAYSVVNQPDASASTMRINGAAYIAGNVTSADSLRFYKEDPYAYAHSGKIALGNARGSLKVGTMRLYDRALTDAERDWNAYVDCVRYCGASAPALAGDYLRGSGPLVIRLR